MKFLCLDGEFVNAQHIRTIWIEEDCNDSYNVVCLKTDTHTIRAAYKKDEYTVDEIRAAIAASLDHESTVFNIDLQLAKWHQSLYLSNMEDGGY